MYETTLFAGGCFWGVEHLLKDIPGVVSTTVGYTGGHIPNPTYEQVCTGKTGHAEAVEIVFDPDLISFKELAKVFFEIHDPTDWNKQGPDIGPQYRSAVFYTNENQRTAVKQLIARLKELGFDVVTEVTPASEFYPAEDYHQKYYVKTGKEPYCHVRVRRF